MILNEEGRVVALLDEIRGDLKDPVNDLHDINRRVWDGFARGELSQPSVEMLTHEVVARRERQAKAAERKDHLGFFSRKLGTTSEDGVEVTVEMTLDETKLRIRRYLGRVASIPALLASYFTISEQAVLSQIAIQCKENGECRLTHGQLAYRARCSERTVRKTLSKVQILPMPLLAIKRRSRQPSIITIVSQAWRGWWSRTTPKTENKKPKEDINLDPPHPALSGQSGSEATPQRAPKVTPPPVSRRPSPPSIVQRIVKAARIVEDALPKPVAPVLPTSIGHGPKPTPGPATGGLDAFLRKTIEEVAKHAGVEPPEQPSAEDLSRAHWEKPELVAPMWGALGSWYTRWDWMLDLKRRYFKNAFAERYPGYGYEVDAEVIDWLKTYVGHSDVAWSMRSIAPTNEGGERRILIAFAREHDIDAFRMRWAGS